MDPRSVYDAMKWWTTRVAVDVIVGFDDSWTSPEGFAEVNQLFKVWLEGLFRWVACGEAGWVKVCLAGGAVQVGGV